MREPDGFELIRLRSAGSAISDRHISRPELTRALFDIESEIVTRSKKHEIENLIGWLAFLRPAELSRAGWGEFMIDAAESAVARLGMGKQGWAQAWVEPVNERLLRAEGTPEALLRRYWELGRGRGHWDPRALGFWIHDVARFRRLGIASEEEVIWRLVGERPFGKYDQERAFSDLEAASMRGSRARPDLDHPAFAAVVRKVCDRIVELELTRGETPEVWSRAAIAIKRLEGARHLARLLGALGPLPLTRKKNHSHEPDLTRPGVLVHLIGACHPAADDTPEDFARLMREAGVSESRLLELAIFRPVWSGFIERATGIGGLRDAVGWIFAHTRSADYQWEANARELWTGEVGFDSPVTAEDFVGGAVDCAWFFRVHQAVGDTVWDKLYAAAKFASTGRGHTRARLFADALLGKSTLPDLKSMLEDKGNLDAALAIGLPELPEGPAERSKDLLERYGILQGFKERSKKSKAQRRASELAAFETGVRNLARRAGFADTLRFEWVMETEASADLEAGQLRARIGDVDLAVGILPDGTLELAATRSGKPLASVPAAVKKDADFKVLRGRMDELKQQARRIRPALEDLMARGVALSGGEWAKLSVHPLAGPLLARLVTDSGRLGLPVTGGLAEPDGKVHAWPAGPVRLAHPVDFLPAERWHGWQRLLFERKITQPFKQVFRELYLPASSETREVGRFEKQVVKGPQAAAILTQRGWTFHPEQGIHRIFRADGIVAWLGFEESFHHFGEYPQLTLSRLHFSGPKPFQRVSVAEVPPRVFSEVLRDVDLIVSVAPAAGADPEATASTVETRSALVRETCRLLGLENVTVEGNHVRIAGKLGNYRVHLTSGVVHRDPGGMIPVHSAPQTERGRIFLPFAEDDAPSVEILSRVLLFAADDQIRDPALAAIVRTSSTRAR